MKDMIQVNIFVFLAAYSVFVSQHWGCEWQEGARLHGIKLECQGQEKIPILLKLYFWLKFQKHLLVCL